MSEPLVVDRIKAKEIVIQDGNGPAITILASGSTVGIFMNDEGKAQLNLVITRGMTEIDFYDSEVGSPRAAIGMPTGGDPVIQVAPHGRSLASAQRVRLADVVAHLIESGAKDQSAGLTP